MTTEGMPHFIPKDAPEIRTERLVIRPVRETDIEAMFTLRGNAEVMKWSTLRLVCFHSNSLLKKPDADISVTMERAKRWGDPESLMLVVSEASDPTARLCGNVGFFTMPPGERVEIGYMFLPDVWGRGYATEAVQAALAAWWDGYAGVRDLLPKEINEQVWAITHTGNFPSYSVLKKSGFEWTEKLQDEHGSAEVWKLEKPKSSTSV